MLYAQLWLGSSTKYSIDSCRWLSSRNVIGRQAIISKYLIFYGVENVFFYCYYSTLPIVEGYNTYKIAHRLRPSFGWLLLCWALLIDVVDTSSVIDVRTLLRSIV